MVFSTQSFLTARKQSSVKIELRDKSKMLTAGNCPHVNLWGSLSPGRGHLRDVTSLSIRLLRMPKAKEKRVQYDILQIFHWSPHTYQGFYTSGYSLTHTAATFIHSLMTFFSVTWQQLDTFTWKGIQSAYQWCLFSFLAHDWNIFKLIFVPNNCELSFKSIHCEAY